jgi:DNA-directed DNA polymerase III PolC
MHHMHRPHRMHHMHRPHRMYRMYRPMSGFVHLHCHSTWSLLDGAIPAESLPHAAAALGYEAVALTDHDSLTGAVRFASACRAAGVKPIYGAELTVGDDEGGNKDGATSQSKADDRDRDLERRRRAGPSRGDPQKRFGSRGKRPDPEPPRPTSTQPCHVTVIARDATGYGNLCRLISDAHLGHERGEPRTTMAKIAERAEGLFVLSGCEGGEVARRAQAGAIPQAIDAARRWRDAIGDGYRIEVFDHRGYGDHTLRNRLVRIARETGIKAVATNDVHYAAPIDAATHEVLHSIKEIVPLSRTRALRRNSEYFLKAPEEMRELFLDLPEPADETLRTAEQCEFDLDLGNYHFPHVPLPRGESPTALLARRCYEGAARRYDKTTRTIDERLQHELRLIFKMGFAAYFLLVADIVEHTRNSLGIRCACRGSATGSLVCYVLGISDVDPVRYDLLFERFMNERREEIPDIDIDVESHRREEVLDHILHTYGADQTAMCCMVDTFRARGAIREVGKALGLPPDEIDLVAKAFPRVRAKDIPQAIDRLPELAGSNLDAGQLTQLFELCLAIDGFPRHLALHPSGVVLSSPDLADRVPMQESFGGFTMLQADKDDVEELGLPKLDILGVRMLSAITHAAKEMERVRGEKLDLESMRRDDARTFELIRSSRTLGCFQIESPGQRELLARFQPDRFEDLIVDISLFRPGPVKSDMVSPFLERHHGFEEVRYMHPILKPILKETNGVIVYHEQVIRVIAAITGCSLDDADYVRRHLDAERPAAPDDPDGRPGRSNPDGTKETPQRSSSHPGMGRQFRGLPEAIVAGAEVVRHFGNGRPERLGEDWVRDQRVHYHGVAGPIEITPPDDDVGTWFVSSAVDNGFSPRRAQELWREVFSFASFGFCKSHAAAFALPTYISAWLKAHHPAAFLAGVLTHDPGMYPRRLIVADARHFSIPILPIDVNASDATYRVEPVHSEVASDVRPSRGARRPAPDRRGPAPSAHAGSAGSSDRRRAPQSPRSGPDDRTLPKSQDGQRTLPPIYGIRLALLEVRDISEAEVSSLVAARREAPFASLEDLWRRADLSRPVLENLVHVGALDSIEPSRTRRELLWRVTDLAATATIERTPVMSQGVLELEEPIQEALPGLLAYTPLEETEAELEISGIDARQHIMNLYSPLLAELGCVSATELARCRNDSEVWVAGVKVASQTPAIRSGQRIIFVTLDDLTGPIDVTVFERVQPRCARTVFHSWLLLVRGMVRKRGGASLIRATDPTNVGITVVAQEVFDLVELAEDRRAHTLAASLGRQRRKQTLTGLTTAGADTAPTKLWHSSGGSAGR